MTANDATHSEPEKVGPVLDLDAVTVDRDRLRELVADERVQKIISLLQDAGGSAPQQAFVEELDWSPAKVSYVLDSLDDSGLIEKISVGRSNRIYLPPYAPETDREIRREMIEQPLNPDEIESSGSTISLDEVCDVDDVELPEE